MPANRLLAATRWITAAALHYPQHLVEHVMDREGLSRPAARRLLAQLTEAGWIVRSGTARHPQWTPGLLRQVVQSYALDGLAEDLPWQRDFAPCLQLTAPVVRLLQHVFCELLNNAIEHSGGTQVTVSLRQTPSHVQLLVSDDGLGLFERVRRSFAIDEPRLALLEISKGKLTSDPDTHTGRGLHSVARLADVFDLQANGSAFQHRAWEAAGWHDGRAGERQGTSIYVSVAIETDRTLDRVLADASADGAGWVFDATVVPLHLLQAPNTALDSRAQARRVAARLQDFRRVALDFSGVAEVGPAFADELFRVLPRSCPSLDLQPAGMTPRVAAQIAAVRAIGRPAQPVVANADSAA